MEGSIVFLIAVLCIYFIPAGIAYQRKHSLAGGVLALNVFLGWTVVFWVVAMIWAAAGRTEADDELRRLQIEALKRQAKGGDQ